VCGFCLHSRVAGAQLKLQASHWFEFCTSGAWQVQTLMMDVGALPSATAGPSMTHGSTDLLGDRDQGSNAIQPCPTQAQLTTCLIACSWGWGGVG